MKTEHFKFTFVSDNLLECGGPVLLDPGYVALLLGG